MTAKMLFTINTLMSILLLGLAGCDGDRNSTKKQGTKSSPNSQLVSKSAKAALPQNGLGTASEKKTPDFDTALDSNIYYQDRVTAALKLKTGQLDEVKKLLLERLRKDYNKENVKDTIVLGEIGDEDVAKEIELIISKDFTDGVYTTGKLNSARSHAIESIQKRNQKK